MFPLLYGVDVILLTILGARSGQHDRWNCHSNDKQRIQLDY